MGFVFQAAAAVVSVVSCKNSINFAQTIYHELDYENADTITRSLCVPVCVCVRVFACV